MKKSQSMRKILFRGKKWKTGEWIYGSLICDKEGKPYAICQQSHNPVQNGVIEGWVFGVDPETVGQFIGPKDRNGKEIFEGDIVKDKYGISILIFDDISWALKSPGSEAVDYECRHYFEECVVIGNIHDNPELIS